MNQYYQQSLYLDIKDLCYFLIKKTVIVFIVGFVLAAAFVGYKYSSYLKSINTLNNMSIFDASNKLNNETDVEFSERVRNLNHAKDLINSIDVLNNQIENQRIYVSDSVYMQINSEKEAVTTANLLVKTNDSNINGSDLALVTTYQQYILSGEYLTELSEELGINQGYLLELIRVDYKTSSNIISNVDVVEKNNVGVISLTVIGTSTELTDKIMDTVIESVYSKCLEYNNTMPPHSVSVAARQSSYLVDNTTRDRQINVTNRFETLQQQIANFDKSLDVVANNLGINKSSLYSLYSFNDYEVNKPSFTFYSAFKYSILGFFIGVVIILMIYVVIYIFDKKFSTQACFFCRFSIVKKIGVVKPTYKRTRFERYIDIMSGDDNKLSYESSNALMSSNIKNLTKGMNKICLTGTAEYIKKCELVKSLGLDVEVKDNFFTDPNSLGNISEYDGIILVEQRHYSDCRLIAEELKLIENANIRLIGAIVI